MLPNLVNENSKPLHALDFRYRAHLINRAQTVLNLFLLNLSKKIMGIYYFSLAVLNIFSNSL